MSIGESLLPEYDHEMATTRKHLERTPLDQKHWKPHDKSMTLGRLASHLAEVPSWTAATMTQTELDMNPVGGPAYTSPDYGTMQELLATFDANVKAGREALAAAQDADFMVPWSLKSAGQTFFTLPRIAVLRSFVMNHLIHHRGQFTVYLRLRNVMVPGSYGPSADEQ